MGALTFLYGAACYAFFLATFLYAIGFVGNFLVPRSIDGAAPDSLGAALLVNVVLLGIFAVQHSVMARPAFKRWWTRIVPRPVERSTYVAFASAALALLFWKWQPIPAVVWHVDDKAGVAVLYGVFALGWLIVLLATFMINHFDLFGLRQVYLRLIGVPYSQVDFKTVGFYKHMRHPIMFGFLVAFWATPHMSAGHLLFSVATTAYIFIGIFLEERDLAAAHGATFQKYRREVPMILPLGGSSDSKADAPLSGSPRVR
ncbi:MAG TPA: hypothetical protein VM183_07445 [Burkholderiales bacterium]|nr:hypothetical protein [Burkholderiales bacterium]